MRINFAQIFYRIINERIALILEPLHDAFHVRYFGRTVISRVNIAIADIEAEVAVKGYRCLTVFIGQNHQLPALFFNQQTPDWLHRMIECYPGIKILCFEAAARIKETSGSVGQRFDSLPYDVFIRFVT